MERIQMTIGFKTLFHIDIVIIVRELSHQELITVQFVLNVSSEWIIIVHGLEIV